MLASFASNPIRSRGRLHHELPTPYRNEFARDRDRLIHSNAFKRLQYKTQIFVNHEGDHYRNRLTHSIEVSSVARSIAKTLRLSDDLAECVALAHDLGHTPFGHVGEVALNECMNEYNGFSHNAHSLKILTQLEHKYAGYDGLNLSWEVLEGIIKHNGPLTNNINEHIIEYNAIHDLDLSRYSSAEAQLASLSDDIAYLCHDFEDSIHAKIVDFNKLSELELMHQYVIDVTSHFPDITASRLIYEVVRKLIHYLIEDLLLQTKINIDQQQLETSDDVRNLGHQLVDFSEEAKEQIKKIKHFLFYNVYKHEKVAIVSYKCQKIVIALFGLYMNDIKLLPSSWYKLVDPTDVKRQALIIGDYVAGMTDRFAIKQYQSYYNITFDDIL